MLPDLIECAVKPVVVDQLLIHAEQIVQRGRIIPMIRDPEFGASRAKPSDGVQGGHLTPRDALATTRQKLCVPRVQAEPMPKPEGEVRIAEVATTLTRKARRSVCTQSGAKCLDSKPGRV